MVYCNLLCISFYYVYDDHVTCNVLLRFFLFLHQLAVSVPFRVLIDLIDFGPHY